MSLKVNIRVKSKGGRLDGMSSGKVTATANTKSCCFVLFRPNQPRRDSEYDDARAKSHAARVGHQRRISRKKVKQELDDDYLPVNWQSIKSEDDDITDEYREFVHGFPAAIQNLKGSCDPFNATAVQITPRINQIIIFIRDVAIPAAYFNNMFAGLTKGVRNSDLSVLKENAVISRSGAQKAWNAIIDSLDDELTALSRIMGYSSLLATLSPEIRWTKAFQNCMRGRALRLLSEALGDEKQNIESNPKYQQIIYGLFQAACIESDLKAVQTHGAMLRKLFEKGFCTPHLIIQALMFDGDFATKHDRRCVLDVDFWYPRVFTPIWSVTKAYFPRTPAAGRDIHETVTVPELREFIARTRDTSDIMEHNQFTKKLDSVGTDRTFAESVTKGLLDCAQLNHLYLDLADEDQGRVIGASVGQRHTQAALAAAVQFVKRRVGSEAMINGKDYRDANGTIIRRLRFSLLKAFKTCTLTELFELAEAHLWLLFVGTEYEVKIVKDLKLVRFSWFAKELSQQAHLMEVIAWPQMRGIALRFLFADFVEPHGSLWYEKLMDMKCHL